MTRYIRKKFETATIASSGTTSDAVNIGDHCPVAVVFPLTTGTSFTFQVSTDGSTFQTLKDESDADVSITKTAASATTHTIDPAKFVGFTHVKIVSGSTEGAERSIQLVCYTV